MTYPDDVARNIRAEQNRDAAPSPEEQQEMKQEWWMTHAQYKAASAFLDRYDIQEGTFQLQAAAKFLGCDELYQKMRSRMKFGQWKRRHREAHEISDDDPRERPEFPVTDIIRQLKLTWFMEVQEAIEEVEDIRLGSKILNPFGAKNACVLVIEMGQESHRRSLREQHVYTNRIFDNAMDDEKWGERFHQRKIDDYQHSLKTMQQKLIAGR